MATTPSGRCSSARPTATSPPRKRTRSPSACAWASDSNRCGGRRWRSPTTQALRASQVRRRPRARRGAFVLFGALPSARPSVHPLHPARRARSVHRPVPREIWRRLDMKQAMLCVLATAAAVTGSSHAPCLAAGGEERARLDRELDLLLASSAQVPAAGPVVHGLLRTRWAYLPEVLPGDEDLNGFSIDRAQIAIGGPVGADYGYRVQLEAAGGPAQLLDAYGTWQADERVRVTMGRFRSPLMWESQLDDGDVLFLTRTDSGELFYGRDEGA